MMASAMEPHGRLGLASLLALALSAAPAARADEDSWRVELEPVWATVTGHDQHVLTRATPGGDQAVRLDTDSSLGYRVAVRHDRGRWGYGLDFFTHHTEQNGGPLTEAAAAGGGALVFEMPHRSFVSTGPDEVLYFRTLDDTTVQYWVGDLFASRRFGSGDGPWSLVFGVRNADFDNDHRAIAGVGEIGGTRLDASSNYSRMIGPMIGVAATWERGRHVFELDLRQSVVFGDIELTRTLRDFEGPPGAFGGPPEEVPPAPIEELIKTTDSIEVPMTDLMLAWRYALGEHWTVGARFAATAWWGLEVPPGVVPERPDARETVDLMNYGLGLTLGFSF